MNEIISAYQCDDAIQLWIIQGTQSPVCVPLSMMNRHGLIAWATGTWKSRTIQLMIEQLSSRGVATLVLDVKWDLSWLAIAGDSNERALQRSKDVGIEYKPTAFPVEMLSLSWQWAIVRSTVTEIWPLLLSRLLELNDTQYSVLSLIFGVCDQRWLTLLDLHDLVSVLNRLWWEWKQYVPGMVSPATLGTIVRKVMMLQSQWWDALFWEPSFDVVDLLRPWVINLLDVSQMQQQPMVFATLMMSMIAEIYQTFPEAWDLKQPKLVIIIDEAHLLFDNSSNELQRQIISIIKLIRSKWVGIFFCTQLPDDIPAEVLSQLGCKIQHALRAFTERDRKAIKAAVENYPISTVYKLDSLITELGIGEAMVTCLDTNWVPTPVAHTIMRPPMSLMGIADASTLMRLKASGYLVSKYAQDRKSVV